MPAFFVFAPGAITIEPERRLYFLFLLFLLFLFLLFLYPSRWAPGSPAPPVFAQNALKSPKSF